jgi:transcriptional regulator with XRE-family HTH domain
VRAMVKEALTLLEWSESKLGRASGVSQPTINRFLSGKRNLSDEARRKIMAAIEAEMQNRQKALNAEWAANDRILTALHEFRQLSEALSQWLKVA